MSEDLGAGAGYQANTPSDSEETGDIIVESFETLGGRLFFSFVDALTIRYGVDRTQVCVGVALVLLISLNLILTSYAWKRYSSVIANFFEEEKKEKFEKKDEAKEATRED